MINISYEDMPKEIMALSAEIEDLEKENKHLKDLQKSIDKQYEELEQENQQLKEQIRRLEDSLFDKDGNNRVDMMCGERQLYINVLDEIREVLNNQMDYREFVDMINKIEEILDKAGKE